MINLIIKRGMFMNDYSSYYDVKQEMKNYTQQGPTEFLNRAKNEENLLKITKTLKLFRDIIVQEFGKIEGGKFVPKVVDHTFFEVKTKYNSEFISDINKAKRKILDENAKRGFIEWLVNEVFLSVFTGISAKASIQYANEMIMMVLASNPGACEHLLKDDLISLELDKIMSKNPKIIDFLNEKIKADNNDIDGWVNRVKNPRIYEELLKRKHAREVIEELKNRNTRHVRQSKLNLDDVI